MVFKIYYCDSSGTADVVMDHYLAGGYEKSPYDRMDCTAFDTIPNEMDFTKTKIVIKDDKGNEIYNDSFRVWRHYLVIFEDNTIITLRRNFYPGERSTRNREKMNEFINAIREKLNQSNAVIIQDDDEDFVV